MIGNYKVITLCGSTRFKDEFLQVQKELTLQGNIVISVGLFGHAGDFEVWENMSEGTLTKTKEMLDDMHKRKIDMADEIFVINVGGYIGDSTKSEIEYAKEHDNFIIDARLGWYAVPESFKVYLTIDINEAAKRAFYDEDRKSFILRCGKAARRRCKYQSAAG